MRRRVGVPCGSCDIPCVTPNNAFVTGVPRTPWRQSALDDAALDAAAGRAGWAEGEIRTKMFRHTYCAARLQTATRVLPAGATGLEDAHWIPIGRDEVARELGHGGTSLVAKVYGHLGDQPHRGEPVECRVEQHKDKLAPRLKLLRAA